MKLLLSIVRLIVFEIAFGQAGGNMHYLIIRGKVVHCDQEYSLKIYENGYIIVHKTKIKSLGDISQLENEKERLEIDEYEEIVLKDSQLLLPGLIDTHIHAPQYPNIGLGYDMPLLQWLEKYTFKIEAKFSDLEFSQRVYDAVVRKGLSYGTTTACYFASIYTDSSLLLADCCIEQGQRAFIGKINMIRNSPEYYVENNINDSVADTERFIQAVLAKQSDLVHPIVTPRFAISVNNDLMLKLSELAKKYQLPIQTHISENCDEVAFTKSLYGYDYAQVYDNVGLLTNKTILAHAVYLNDDEINLIAHKGASISHCPSSNLRLQSGICPVRRLMKFGINIGLGTDVSGGSSVSIIEMMRTAVDSSLHLSFQDANVNPLTFHDVFYMATLGGAKALKLEDKIGNFDVGKDFDAIIVDLNAKNASADLFGKYDAAELLQKFIYTGDDRNVVNVYVAGKKVK